MPKIKYEKTSEYLAIKNWNKFQSKRVVDDKDSMPWIRDWTDKDGDFDFSKLTALQRYVLDGCRRLRARFKQNLNNEPAWIATALCMLPKEKREVPSAIATLVFYGFLIPTDGRYEGELSTNWHPTEGELSTNWHPTEGELSTNWSSETLENQQHDSLDKIREDKIREDKRGYNSSQSCPKGNEELFDTGEESKEEPSDPPTPVRKTLVKNKIVQPAMYRGEVITPVGQTRPKPKMNPAGVSNSTQTMTSSGLVMADIRDWAEDRFNLPAERIRNCIRYQLDIAKNEWYRNSLTLSAMNSEKFVIKLHGDTPFDWSPTPKSERKTFKRGDPNCRTCCGDGWVEPKQDKEIGAKAALSCPDCQQRMQYKDKNGYWVDVEKVVT